MIRSTVNAIEIFERMSFLVLENEVIGMSYHSRESNVGENLFQKR